MTPAEKAGLKIGDKVVMLKDVGDGGEYFKAGEEAIFEEDDGTQMPAFKYLKRQADQAEDDTGPYWYVDIDDVKKVVEDKPKTFDVSTQEIKCYVTTLTFKRLLTQGYRITVTSWENDADNYNTKIISGLSLEDAKFTVDFIKLFKSQNDIPAGIGNMYDPNPIEISEAHQAVAEVFNKHEWPAHFTFEDWHDVAYDLGLSRGEFFTRVMESFVVEYIPEDIVIKNVTGEFE